MIVKVKEPQEEEWKRLSPGKILFTYLHLAPDPRQTQGAARIRLHGDRLRDRHRSARRAAAACADERGRGAAGDRGGGAVAETLQRRARTSDRRRAGRAGGACRGARRRRGRHACGAHGGGPRRRGHGARQVAAAASRARRAFRGTRADALLLARVDRGGSVFRRRGDRRGAGAGRERAKARHARAC